MKRPSIRIVALVIVAVALLVVVGLEAADHAGAYPGDFNEGCQACHSWDSPDGAPNWPHNVAAHESVMTNCSNCHIGSPSAGSANIGKCAACHGGVTPIAASPSHADQECAGCHVPSVVHTISGTVTDEVTSLGIENVDLWAIDSAGNWRNGVSTDSNGAYTIPNLYPGDYRIRTTWNAQGYLDEWYDNIFYQTDPSGTGATIITLDADTTDINFALSTGRTISGVVTDDGSTPLTGVELAAVDADGNWVGWAYTGEAGAYTFTGLYPGAFRIRTWTNWRGYADQWYNGVPASGDPTGSGATPADVTLMDAIGIDFALGADDATAPDTVITGMNGGTWHNGLISFVCTPLPAVYWRVSDDYGSGFSEVSVDSGGWQPAPGASGWTGTHHLRLGPLADGPHTVAVRAYDFVGNVDPTPATHEFVVDTAPPVLTWDAPADGLVTTTRTATFSGSATDATSEVKRVIIELNTPSGRVSFEPPLAADPDVFDYIYPGDTTWSLDVALPAGVTSARVGSLDAAGNPTAPSDWRSLTVDVTDAADPETTLDPYSPFAGWGAFLRGSATDDAGLAGAEYSTDAGASWTAVGSSPFGYIYPGSDRFSLQPDGSANWRTVIGNLAEGVWHILIRARDLVGNVDQTPAEAQVTVEKEAPTFNWDPFPGARFPGLSLDLSGTATDATSGVQTFSVSVMGFIYPLDAESRPQKTYYQDHQEWSPPEDADIFDYIYPNDATLLTTLTLPAEGHLWLTARARDAAGNVSASERREIWMGVPELQWDLPSDDLTTASSAVTFSGSATDVGSGVKRVVLELETPRGTVAYEPTLDADADIFDYIYPGDTTWSKEVTLPVGTTRARVAVFDQSGLTSGPSEWRSVTIILQKDVTPGWNLLGGAPDSDVLGQTAFGYTEGSYLSTTGAGFEAGRGYWVRFPSAGTVTIATVFAPLLMHLEPGWNLIGNPTPERLTFPSGLTGFVYAGGTYASRSYLDPGEGAWVKVTSTQDVLLGG